MVMVSNQTGYEVGLLAGRYPGALGHLYSPGGERGPFEGLPYALDNGAYVLAGKNLDFDFDAWMRLLHWAKRAPIQPLWAAVPDKVYHRDETIEWWHQHHRTVRAMGFRPAFVAQNGMTHEDVPADDCMVFLGGSDEFKDAAIKAWPPRLPGRIHVGRVNWEERLWRCYDAGAVSVDGTGWYRRESGANGGQRAQLRRFIEQTHRKEPHAVYRAAV